MKRLGSLVGAFVATGLLIGGITLLSSKASGANLIANPSAETPSSNSSIPEGWHMGAWGSNTPIFTYQTTGAHSGARSLTAELVSYVDGDAKWSITPVAITAGKYYTYSDYYKSNVQTEMFAQFIDQNGAATYEWLGTVPASASWAQAKFTFAAPQSARKVSVLHIIKSVGSVTIDDVSLTEYAPPLGTNFVPNASFEQAAPGNAAMPESWQKSSWGTNTASLQYLSSGARTGNRSAKITLSNYTDGDAKWFFAPALVQPGKQYTYTDFYKSTIPSRVVLVTYDANNAATYTDLATNVPAGSATWQAISRTFTVPANAQKVTVYHLIAGNGWLQIDDAELTEVPAAGSNIVGNSSVELSANGSVPDGWASDAWGTNTPVFSYAATGRTGTRSIKTQLTSYTSGDAKWTFTPVAVTPNTEYTYKDYYQSNVQSQLVLQYTHQNGSISYASAGSLAPAAAWAEAKLGFTTPPTATKVTVYHLISRVGFLVVDDVDLRLAAPPLPVPNSGLEQANPANTALPLSWRSDRWGGNTTSFQYLTTGGHNSNRSVKVTLSNYADGDAKWMYDAKQLVPGNSYRFTVWYKTNVQPQAAVQFVRADGSTYYRTLPTPLPGTNSATTWQQYNDTFTMPADAKSASAFLLINRNGWLQTDDYAVTPYTMTGFTRPLVTLTFDDGQEENVDTALPALNARGIKSTHCYATDHVEGDQQNIQRVLAFRDSGHEICSHTVTHPFLSQLSAAQLSYELTHSKQVLESATGQPVRNFASPYGDYSAAVLAAIKPLYRSHRSVDEGYNSKDNLDAYRLKVQNVESDTTLAEYQSWLNKAKATNTWLILVYHRITPSNPGPFDSYQADFNVQLDAVKASGLTVKTYNDALNEIIPQL